MLSFLEIIVRVGALHKLTSIKYMLNESPLTRKILWARTRIHKIIDCYFENYNSCKYLKIIYNKIFFSQRDTY